MPFLNQNNQIIMPIEGYKRVDHFNEDVTERIKEHYVDIIAQLGEDPEREGLIKTPERVAKSLQFLTQG